MNRSTLRRGLVPAGIVLSLALTLTACGGDSSSSSDLSGAVKIDGSSTVAPFTNEAAQGFGDANTGVEVSVGISGTGGGFEKFCNGETDGNDASRPIKDTESSACEENNVEYTSLEVALDALTVVVNKENTWAKCLTVAQLNKIWGPDSKVTNWNQVDASYPDVELALYGPGTDSGTFDYFTDVINGEEGASTTEYSPSENDNDIVTGVEGSKGGLGYFGFTYFEENAEKLNAVEVDSGKGCVAPSAETAQNGTYTPLSRPLFVYPSKTSVTDKPQVAAFFDYLVENDASIAEASGFIPLGEEASTKLESDWNAFKG